MHARGCLRSGLRRGVGNDRAGACDRACPGRPAVMAQHRGGTTGGRHVHAGNVADHVDAMHGRGHAPPHGQKAGGAETAPGRARREHGVDARMRPQPAQRALAVAPAIGRRRRGPGRPRSRTRTPDSSSTPRASRGRARQHRRRPPVRRVAVADQRRRRSCVRVEVTELARPRTRSVAHRGTGADRIGRVRRLARARDHRRPQRRVEAAAARGTRGGAEAARLRECADRRPVEALVGDAVIAPGNAGVPALPVALGEPPRPAIGKPDRARAEAGEHRPLILANQGRRNRRAGPATG